MIDRHEGRIGDDVERLLAAIIRMRPPADIGQRGQAACRSRRSSAVSSSPEEPMNLSVS